MRRRSTGRVSRCCFHVGSLLFARGNYSRTNTLSCRVFRFEQYLARTVPKSTPIFGPINKPRAPPWRRPPERTQRRSVAAKRLQRPLAENRNDTIFRLYIIHLARPRRTLKAPCRTPDGAVSEDRRHTPTVTGQAPGDRLSHAYYRIVNVLLRTDDEQRSRSIPFNCSPSQGRTRSTCHTKQLTCLVIGALINSKSMTKSRIRSCTDGKARRRRSWFSRTPGLVPKSTDKQPLIQGILLRSANAVDSGRISRTVALRSQWHEFCRIRVYGRLSTGSVDCIALNIA